MTRTGRPPKPLADVRGRLFRLKQTEQERRELIALAAASPEKKPSRFVRRLIQEAKERIRQ